jgi:hypothetical protein
MIYSQDPVNTAVLILEILVLSIASFQLMQMGWLFLGRKREGEGDMMESRIVRVRRKIRISPLDPAFKVGLTVPVSTSKGYLKGQSVR